MSQQEDAVAREAMVDPEVVQQIRGLSAQGVGAKRIAKELGVSKNTVKRHLRGGPGALVQARPQGAGARRRAAWARRRAVRHRRRGQRGRRTSRAEARKAPMQACARCSAWSPSAGARSTRPRSRASATRRRPATRTQVDFAQKKVWIGDALVTMHLLVATLCYSRRVFVKAS
jgi:hypothetical protein